MGDLVEGLSLVVFCLLAGQPLPSSDSGVDILGIKLHAVCSPACAFSSDDSGAAAHERVQNDLAATRAI